MNGAVGVLSVLEQVLDARDPFTRGHAARVVALAEMMACRLGWTEQRRGVLRLGGVLHDVGKLVVSPDVLAKAGPLSADEAAEIRRHPAAGAQLVELLGAPRPALPAILYHHERWDG